MDEILNTLNSWLIWFENPSEPLPPALVEENAQIGFCSCGFNSNRFICQFETEKVTFDVTPLMNDKPGEENAAALVKLAVIALHTPFEEPVEIKVTDASADYNGGTLDDFLTLIDKLRAPSQGKSQVIYP